MHLTLPLLPPKDKLQSLMFSPYPLNRTLEFIDVFCGTREVSLLVQPFIPIMDRQVVCTKKLVILLSNCGQNCPAIEQPPSLPCERLTSQNEHKDK